jgi:hypothetical protein
VLVAASRSPNDGVKTKRDKMNENEEVEGLLVDLGVGYIDADGMYQEGVDINGLDGDDPESCGLDDEWDEPEDDVSDEIVW